MEEAKVSIISNGSSPMDEKHVHVSNIKMQHPVAADSTTATAPPVLSWVEYLDDPVLLHILSFLNFKELCQGPLWVNRRFYQLIVTNEVLWKELYRREYWPTMATFRNDVARATWVVDMNLNISLLMGGTIPDIARDSNHDNHSHQPSHDTSIVAHDTTTTNAPTNSNHKIINYPLLFSLACHSYREPTCIHNELISITRGLEEIEFLTVPVAGNPPSQTHNKIPAYRFTGQVGPGNRCIRANRALPRPMVVSIQDNDNEGDKNEEEDNPQNHEVNPQNNDNNLQNDDMIPQHNNHNNPQNNNHDTMVPRPRRPRRTKWMVPFVSPLHKVSTSGQAEIHLTPRLIAYFEVTLHPPPPPSANQPSAREQQAEALQNILRQQQQAAAAGRQRHWIRRRDLFLLAMAHEQDHDRQECIAVGIGTERFAFDHRMPGWDRYSYGYHGDDGGLYHGSGHFRANRSRLPRFGVGDTVGCGIDYAQRSLFFTLNGNFLGYHFGPNNDDHDGDNDFLFHQDFYPVVGMDATCCVSVNFGQERPFVFDLTTTMIPKDRAVMEHVIQRLPRCFLYNDSDSDDEDEEEDDDDDEDEDDDALSSGEDDDEVFDYFGFGRHDPDGSDDSYGGNNDMDNDDDDDDDDDDDEDSTSLDDDDDEDDDESSEREQMQFSSESEDDDDDDSEPLGF